MGLGVTLAMLAPSAASRACGGYRLATPEGYVTFEHAFVRDSAAGVVLSVASTQRWAAIGRVDRPDRVARAAVLRWTGDRVMLGDAVRARIDGEQVRIGARTFLVRVTATSEGGLAVAVTEDGAAVLTGGVPPAMCGADAAADVRMRLVLYLAWRIGARAGEVPPPPRMLRP